MKGKYRSLLHYWAAKLIRSHLRNQIRSLVSWNASEPLESGCAAIIGMCSALADVLPANLRCLENARWPDLKEVIIVADCRRESLPEDFETTTQKAFPNLKLRFGYYNERQFAFSRKAQLPYVFSWLSWSIALSMCRMRTVLIHDYDALVFGRALERRYEEFCRARVKIQGVVWYWVNGFVPEDRMASTFEAFADTAWIKQFEPVMMFNQIGMLNGRSVDFDTLLDIQANHTAESHRTIVPMNDQELAHPTQMIHQYTIFKKYPGKPWFSASTTMIPFFIWLSGKNSALSEAAARLLKFPKTAVPLMGDDCIINFSTLETEHLEQRLRMMVQVCLNLNLPPAADLAEYGRALYAMHGISEDKRWLNGYSETQKRWIRSSEALLSDRPA